MPESEKVDKILSMNEQFLFGIEGKELPGDSLFNPLADGEGWDDMCDLLQNHERMTESQRASLRFELSELLGESFIDSSPYDPAKIDQHLVDLLLVFTLATARHVDLSVYSKKDRYHEDFTGVRDLLQEFEVVIDRYEETLADGDSTLIVGEPQRSWITAYILRYLRG